jgi:hypothetical protein
MPELHKQMLAVLGLQNIDKIIPGTKDKKPADPVTENMNILSGKPVKAFLYQDQQSHIRIHMAAMQDPKVQAIVGQSPQAPVIMAAMQAHIAEHVAFEYRKQIEAQMGVALPDPEKPLPEEVELRLSRVLAEAADRLLQKNTAEAQAEQNQKAQQDPLIQMQQQELQIKQAEVQRKQAKDQADIQAAQAKLGLQAQEKRAELMLNVAKLEANQRTSGAKLGVEAARSRAELEAKQRLAGTELGVRIAEHTATLRHERQQSHADRRHEAEQAAKQPRPKSE